MRNLIAYPITTDEALKAFQDAVNDSSCTLQNAAIGSIDDYALSLIGNFLKQNREQLTSFLQDCQRMDGI